MEKQLKELQKLIAQQTPQSNSTESQDFSIPQRDNIILANFAVTDGIYVGFEPLKLEPADPINFEIIKEKPRRYKSPKIIIPKSKFDYEPEMVFVRGGSFEMDYQKITLSDFYIGKYSVTQAEWQAIIGINPSHFKDNEKCPVESVSWNDCEKYIQRLNEKTNKNYRFLTDAEWEYAAKGGIHSKGYNFSGSNNIDEVAWYWRNSGDIKLTTKRSKNKVMKNNCRTHPVGTKVSNELGIYDMSGNVYEWCNDWYDEDYYRNIPSQDPQGGSYGTDRILRGGSWFFLDDDCRSIVRTWNRPNSISNDTGFRLALSIM